MSSAQPIPPRPIPPPRPILPDAKRLRIYGLLSPEVDGWQWISPEVLHSPNYITGSSCKDISFRYWERLPNEVKDTIAGNLSDKDLSSLSHVTHDLAGLFRPRRAARRKSYLKIPVWLDSHQTLEWLGFESERAKFWIRTIPRMPLTWPELYRFMSQMWNTHMATHPSHTGFQILGLKTEIVQAIMNPAWKQIRITQSLHYWVCDTVHMRLLALNDIIASSTARCQLLFSVCERCQPSYIPHVEYKGSQVTGLAALTSFGTMLSTRHQSKQLPCCRLDESEREAEDGGKQQHKSPSLGMPSCGVAVCYRKRHSFHEIFRIAYEAHGLPELQKGKAADIETEDFKLFHPTTLYHLYGVDRCPRKPTFEDFAIQNNLMDMNSGLVTRAEAPVILYEWHVAEALARYAESRGGSCTKIVILELAVPSIIFQRLFQRFPKDLDVHLLEDTTRATMLFPHVQFRGSDKTQKVPEGFFELRKSLDMRLRYFRAEYEPILNNPTCSLMTDREYFQYVVWQQRRARIPGCAITPLFTPRLIVGPIPVDRHHPIHTLPHWKAIGPDYILWRDEIPSMTAARPQPESKDRRWVGGSREAEIQFIFPMAFRREENMGGWSTAKWFQRLFEKSEINVRDLDWPPAKGYSYFGGLQLWESMTEWVDPSRGDW